jgi:hypothetical protein
MDLILTGQNGDEDPVSTLYENDGSGQFTPPAKISRM